MFVCCCYIIMCGIESDRCGSIRLLFPSAFLCVMPVHNMLYLHPIHWIKDFVLQLSVWGDTSPRSGASSSQEVKIIAWRVNSLKPCPQMFYPRVGARVRFNLSIIKYFSQWGIICISVGKLWIMIACCLQNK